MSKGTGNLYDVKYKTADYTVKIVRYYAADKYGATMLFNSEAKPGEKIISITKVRDN